MADKYINQLSADRNTVYDTSRLDPNVVHDVRANTGGTEQLIKTLDGFMSKVSHQLDKQTVRKAQLAGSTAGLGDKFKPIDKDTLAAEAYNKAGTEIFINRKLSQASTTINKMAVDPAFRHDPMKLTHALEDQKNEFLKDIPVEVMPDFVVAFEDRASRAVQAAERGRVEMTISRNAAQFAETETVLLAEITNAARGGDENAIAQARTEYFNALDRQIGLSVMPEEAAKKKIALQRQIQKDAVIGEFLRTPDDKRPAFASSFLENNPLADILQAEEIDDLKREMITAWKVDDDLAEAAKADQKELNLQTKKDVLTAFHLAPTPENYTAFIGSEDVTPEEIKAAKSYLSQNISEPDPVVKHQINQAIMSGEYSRAKEMLDDPTYYSALPRETVVKFRQDLADVEAGAGFEKLEPYKEVQRRIKSEYGATTVYGQLNTATGDAIQQQIYDELRVKYPKYLTGELSYEDVDPVRMYNLKKANFKKTEAGDSSVGAEIITSTQGTVVIPQKYLDDPLKFFEDAKRGLGPGLSTPEVQMYMVEERIKREKEEAKPK